MISPSLFNQENYLDELKNRILALCQDANLVLPFQEGLEKIAFWGIQYFLMLLQNNQILCDLKNYYHINDIKKQIEILPCYIRLLNSLFEILVNKKLISSPCQDIYKLEQKELISFELLLSNKKVLAESYPELQTNINFLHNIMENYLLILSGKKNFLDILFANGSFENLVNLYTNDPFLQYYSNLTAETISFFVEHLSAQGQISTNIFEIGAGIGSTSQLLLSRLNHLEINKQYYYTDISAAFLAYGRSRFSSHFHFLNFSKFDMNHPPIIQGYQQNYYDVVLIDNVIHNASDVEQTLKNINLLLKPGGILVLNESVVKKDYSTLIYGLSTGWWNFTDTQWRISGTPLIHLAQWEKLFTSVFFNFYSLNQLLQMDNTMHQDVLIAVKVK